MARSNRVDLGIIAFDTQGKAEAYFREMLRRHRPGERLSWDDMEVLDALIERHPERDEKVGVGVAWYEVMMTEHGTPCFRIVRTDGTGTDFSYRHCVTGRPTTARHDALRAFRHVIQADIFRLRDALFADPRVRVKCAASGRMLTREECHIDHRPPKTFEAIVVTFLEERGLPFERVPVTRGRDEQVQALITDAALAAAFKEHHDRVADLAPVHREINLAQSARHRLRRR